MGQVWAVLKSHEFGQNCSSLSAPSSMGLTCSRMLRLQGPARDPTPLTFDSCPSRIAHQSLPLTPCGPLPCSGPPRECGGLSNTLEAKLQNPPGPLLPSSPPGVAFLKSASWTSLQGLFCSKSDSNSRSQPDPVAELGRLLLPEAAGPARSRRGKSGLPKDSLR